VVNLRRVREIRPTSEGGLEVKLAPGEIDAFRFLLERGGVCKAMRAPFYLRWGEWNRDSGHDPSSFLAS
jgi:hypothetical protein